MKIGVYDPLSRNIPHNKLLNLWVRNISHRTKALQLKTLFRSYGKVYHATVVTRSSRIENYGFISMATPDEAATCVLNLNNSKFRNRTIIVEKTTLCFEDLKKTSTPLESEKAAESSREISKCKKDVTRATKVITAPRNSHRSCNSEQEKQEKMTSVLGEERKLKASVSKKTGKEKSKCKDITKATKVSRTPRTSHRSCNSKLEQQKKRISFLEEKLKVKESVLKEAKKKISVCKNDVREARKVIKTPRNSHRSCNSELEKKKKRISLLGEKLKVKESVFKETKKEISSYKQDLRKARKAIEDNRNSHDFYKNELEKQRSKILSLEEELKVKESISKNAEKEISTYKQYLIEARTAVIDYRNSHYCCKNELEKEKNRVSSLEEELKVKESVSKEAEKEIKKCKQDLTEARKDVEDYRNSQSFYDNELEKQQNRISSLEGELKLKESVSKEAEKGRKRRLASAQNKNLTNAVEQQCCDIVYLKKQYEKLQEKLIFLNSQMLTETEIGEGTRKELEELKMKYSKDLQEKQQEESKNSSNNNALEEIESLKMINKMKDDEMDKLKERIGRYRNSYQTFCVDEKFSSYLPTKKIKQELIDEFKESSAEELQNIQSMNLLPKDAVCADNYDDDIIILE